MDQTKIVKLTEGYFLERLDGEISVHHQTLTTAVYLNGTGALIWELCDGRRTISDIVEVLNQQYPESSTRIETDVKNLIAQLIERDIAALE